MLVESRLKEMREKKGFSQAELGRKVCITTQAINAFELGYRDPTCAVLFRIAKALDCTTDYLLGMDMD